MKQDVPSLADLVFLGGGHTQVAAVKSFAMKPIHGLRLTIVTSNIRTPYSGMLPGYVEGIWSDEDIHINLAYLAQISNARLIVADCVGINAEARQLLFADRPPLHFDLLSVNIGAQPDLEAIDGAVGNVVPVKPISGFLDRFKRFDKAGAPGRVAIIGGGAAGCELALALNRYWQTNGTSALVSLYSRAATLLPGLAPRAGRLMLKALQDAGIDVRCGVEVSKIKPKQLYFANGGSEPFDGAFLTSAVRPPSWLVNSGMELDKDGFIKVDSTLQSSSHPYIFAAGDIATLHESPRPKAGVFAVRAGPVMAKNLRRFLLGQPLIKWRAQKNYLALIGTADGGAIACRGNFAVRSIIALRLKHWIDRRFMQKYQTITMVEPVAPAAFSGIKKPTDNDHTTFDPAYAAIRCLGCAAKTSRLVLDQALAEARRAAIAHGIAPDIVSQGDLRDDVGVLPEAPKGMKLLQSIDALSEIVSDPFLLGKIAAVHALNDLYAAGANPVSALALLNLPSASLQVQQNQLTQILAGALVALGEAGTRLTGGHTSEGGALLVGFAVTGYAPKPTLPVVLPEPAILVLTKPLGTGLIMAGNMQLRAHPNWVAAAIEVMTQSNASAAKIFAENKVIAATDITGFGLARHALNLAKRLGAGGCEIVLEKLPLLPGVVTLSEAGVISSLYDQNRVATPFTVQTKPKTRPQALVDYAVLFDPQTSGGLLGVFEPLKAQKALAELKESGHNAAIIGQLKKHGSGVKIVHHDTTTM
jgi:selenide,water dikinase